MHRLVACRARRSADLAQKYAVEPVTAEQFLRNRLRARASGSPDGADHRGRHRLFLDGAANPNLAPLEFRAKFPPTRIIAGTRAFDLSPALATHPALGQAGSEASLHVFDGLRHCFYYNAATPEGADAYDTIARFFRKHLC